MTDVIPSLLNVHVYDAYEPQTFQHHFPLCRRVLQASICPIWLGDQLFVNLFSCELLVFRNSVNAESVFL